MRVAHFKSLRFSGAEVTAYRLQQEIMDLGYTERNNMHHEDCVAVAYADSGAIAGVIVYRVHEWDCTAHIVLGGTVKDYRRQGVYKLLYSRLRAHISLSYPNVKAIDSGHSVKNKASQAMFRATGRAEPGYLLYQDKLR